jgi:hypothetical protein
MSFDRSSGGRNHRVALQATLFWICLSIASGAAARAANPPQEKVDFARDVRPLLARHCFQCHGTEEEAGGLRLDDRSRALTGGMTGPPIVPGNAAESLLWQFITGHNEDRVVMPPRGRGERLSAAECELVRRWIDQGAPWPEAPSRGQTSMATAGRPAIGPCQCSRQGRLVRSSRRSGRLRP